MILTRKMVGSVLGLLGCALAPGLLAPGPATAAPAGGTPAPQARMRDRWLFVWRDMSNPKEVDRVIARLPRAKADGYNGLVLSYNVAPSRADALKQAARQNGLDIVAIVMGGISDSNYVEGVLSKDAMFVAHNGIATFQPDNPTKVVNGDFEAATGNHFTGWTLQDDEGVTTFADHQVVHDGKTSLRMQDIGKNQYRHCRVAQKIKLQPHREYRISFWLKTQDLRPADAEVKVLTTDAQHEINFQTFHVDSTQDWTHYNLVFNSLDNTDGLLYVGSWDGKNGKMWWDDVNVEEIGSVNMLRRPGCPVIVIAEDGTVYEEGRDYEKFVDPLLHPWQAYHQAPILKLTPDTRIKDGERLRVSYYHSIIVYEDRVTYCLSEPKIFDEWQRQVQQVNDLLHPAAFLMSHDELRVINQCALCQSKHMTPGELLAWNVHKAAEIIRKIRPDAGIWVWSDMFDPMHNAVDHYYAVNGPLAGSWKGLDPGIGIVNWYGGLMGKNCPFFAKLGLRQILSGYYDSDNDGSAIAKWLSNTRDVPGIVGAMYTTWEDNYAAMDTWAQKAWAGGQAHSISSDYGKY